MTRGRNLASTIFLAATIILLGTRSSEAQDQTPPPSMLLNLDLFSAQPGSDHAPATGGESTLEQLRALRAMGYLNTDSPPPVDDDSEQPPDAPTRPVQNSQGAEQ
jgi:hypothetical protein